MTEQVPAPPPTPVVDANAKVAAGHAAVQAPEPSVKKEISPLRQKNEVNHVATMLMSRASRAESGASDENMTPGRQALRNINDTMNSGDKPIEVLDKRTKITKNGKTYIITQIQRVDRKTFKCSFIEEGSSEQTEVAGTFSNDEVLIATLLSEESNLLQAFSGDEQELVKHYFNIIKSGEKALEALDPIQLNELIKRVAQKGGMLRVEDVLESMTERPVPADATPEETEAIKKENELRKTLKPKAEKALEGKNIVTAEDADELGEATGLTQETLEKVGVTGKNMGAYLDQIETGELSQEVAIQIRDHIRSGNIAGIVSLLPEVRPDPNDTPEVAGEKSKRRIEIEKVIKHYGPAIGISAALLGFILATQFNREPK